MKAIPKSMKSTLKNTILKRYREDFTKSSRPFGYVDFPPHEARIQGFFDVTGWVLARGRRKINKIEIKIGSDLLGEAHYGFYRPDVGYANPGFKDRWFPGFFFRINSLLFENGRYELIVSASDEDGNKGVIGQRWLNILNE